MLKKKYKKLLSKCTTFKIGGPVFCWVEAEKKEDILDAVSLSEKENKKLIIVGRGSNILFSDNGFDGIAINLKGEFSDIKKENKDILKIGAGVSIASFMRKCLEFELSGAEFLAGVPGTIGGAAVMNAGANGGEIKDIVEEAEVFDLKNKEHKILKKEDIRFGYRYSDLDDKCVLSVKVRLKKDNKAAILDKISLNTKKREWMKEAGSFSAGSIFKNPSRERTAGKLIEECGLKGKRIGDAEISRMHGNFIVNTGKAGSEDVTRLMELARIKVEEKFGIKLEPEIKIL